MKSYTVGSVLKKYFGIKDNKSILNELVENEYHTLESWADTAKVLPNTLLDVIEYSMNNPANLHSKYKNNSGDIIYELPLASGISISIVI